jgi:tyrosyl-tRNA synthetase
VTAGKSFAVSERDASGGAAILDDLEARALVHDRTDLDLLRARLADGPVTVYAGFDPTADSLHIGSLVPLLLLRRFQIFGHHPIALAGGATGMIGDPSGRSEERSLLGDATLDRYVQGIKGQLERFLDFGSDVNPARLVDNRDWTAPMGVLEFLRDVGKHLTVNVMLAKESVRARVESEHGISYTEFSYMLLQANDYAWLHRHFQCELQVGGSDQWGNITAGIELVRKTTGAHVHGLTVPLVTKADGTKFGKSAGENVWLDPERTSPYEMYQYFMNTDDRDVERFLLQLTLLPVEVVGEVVDAHRSAPEQRGAQRRLAAEVTGLVHGEAAAQEAQEASSGFTRASAGMEAGELEALVDAIPTLRVSSAALGGSDLVDRLVEVGAVASKGEARRLMAQRGITVNDEVVSESRPLGPGDLLHDRFVMLRRGKKQRFLVVVEP